MKDCDSALALCLGSSFFGHYAHCGFLCELEKAGVRPGRISGASAGALAGGMWVGGLRGEELRAEIMKLGFRRAFFDFGALLRVFGMLSWTYSSGILGGNRMKRRLSRLLGDHRIEDFDAPALELAVANMTRGSNEIRTHGPMLEFMLASLSMPLLFRVREIDGERYLDGGVGNELPFDHWLDQRDIQKIVVHRIRHHGEKPTGGRMHPGRVVGDCHAIPCRELNRYRRRAAEASEKEVVFLETRYDRPTAIHGRKTGEALFAAGAATARAWLAESNFDPAGFAVPSR